jgi:hypothetical protein
LPEIRNVEASTNFGDYRVYQNLGHYYLAEAEENAAAQNQ